MNGILVMVAWTRTRTRFDHCSRIGDDALDLVVNPSRNEEQMVNEEIEIRQLDQTMEIPSEGKSTYVLLDDSRVKMMLMGFAAGCGLAEHVAPKDLMIQVIRGELEFTVDQRVSRKDRDMDSNARLHTSFCSSHNRRSPVTDPIEVTPTRTRNRNRNRDSSQPEP